MKNQEKKKGQIYTPDYLVNTMLDFCGYYGESILKKHIIDNSCGEGAFLVAAVRRYCDAFLKVSKDVVQLKKDLQTYIHGIEIDDLAYNNCLRNLNNLTNYLGLDNLNFDILNEDALTNISYNGQMDFVVGNPPYVRVHNLEDRYEQVKKFRFAQGGMTDLYLVFYELGLRMLSPKGVLCYIAPSSWLNSVAANNMRQYIQHKKNLIAIIDLCHFQPFKATTYTMITLLDQHGEHDTVDYYTYNAKENKPVHEATIDLRDIEIEGCFYFSTKDNLQWLRQILSTYVKRHVVVKNGYATLCDKVFIGRKKFREFVIPVVKASTAELTEAFYPYDNHGKPLPFAKIFSNTVVANYLIENRDILLKGKSERDFPSWYLYGRTQGLLDTYSPKFSISSVIKDVESIKIRFCPAGTGVYGGLYILTEVDENKLIDIIKNEKFILFIQLLREYKSGGYYTLNSRRLESYINYQLSQYEL